MTSNKEFKWYRNKEILKNILIRNNKELEKHNSVKVEALLKDENNLIEDHLELLLRLEKSQKAFEILKNKLDITFVYDMVDLFTKQDIELLQEVLEDEKI